ncbi:unnamed protein product [Candidatus Paraburkholderia kirkii UZHbot1]|uniref:WGS project CAFE00000000 data, contig bkir_c11 n=1 Tax=Candidatus Paraburkholderia kirkii UZHbot1 TaxID=1055526 RepID=U3UAE4_9BURK|nr:unnamed protein product [Candidatus Paraburkholderia kirkii UZHbot1]
MLAFESTLQSKPHKSAMAVGSVVLFGTLSIFLYLLALNAGWLHLDTLGAGLFFGGTIHEVAQVVGAASNVSPEATHIATIVKMTRVMLLVPVLLVIGFWISRARGEGSAQGKGKIAVPWFALGFLALVVVNSLHVLPDVATTTINTLDTFALTMAMTALGMETRIAQIREAGPRAIATGAILVCCMRGSSAAALPSPSASNVCSADRYLEVSPSREGPPRAITLQKEHSWNTALAPRTRSSMSRPRHATRARAAAASAYICATAKSATSTAIRTIRSTQSRNQGVICAKGASGIMKQYSPARLTQPLMRKKGALRGEAQFEPVSWDVALDTLEKRLAHLRATDPKKFALFTGRDQMQALTGLFAKNFGTPNYAAHGDFCSANMAAGMIYTIGGPFWECGGPDLDQAKLFFMIGTAEDHHSNPLKIAISKFKRAGGRFIAINPVRTGYAAIADEWGVRPGTDGALFMALIHELIAADAWDHEFVARYTNAAELLDMNEASDTFGLFLRNGDAPEGNALFPQNHLWWWDTKTNRAVAHHTDDAEPALDGRYTLEDGTPVAPSFALLREQVATCTAQWAAEITGIPAATIKRLAAEMIQVSRDHKITLPIEWTDAWGRKHATVTGNPIAFHAMRGLAAHSNGFQSIRALAVLMSMLGTIDRPGGFRHKSPFPRALPPSAKPPNHPDRASPTHRFPRVRSAGPPRPRICSSMTTARPRASTRHSPGNIRSRCTA